MYINSMHHEHVIHNVFYGLCETNGAPFSQQSTTNIAYPVHEYGINPTLSICRTMYGVRVVPCVTPLLLMMI